VTGGTLDFSANAASATLGCEITIVRAGLYYMKMRQTFNAAAPGVQFGITKNSAALTTNISSQTDNSIIATACTHAANIMAEATALQWLVAGDIIRPHDDNGTVGATNDDDHVQFFIQKLR
jgi:hypothetical protein